MERVNSLFQFSKKVSFKKTDFYKKLEQQNSLFKQEGFMFEPNSFFDLYCYEIILKGIENKIKIAKAYDIFISDNFDLIEHCTYDQRRKMIQTDLDKVLDQSVSFMYKENSIYIPYLEDFMNQRYCYDHAVVALKQHMEYLKQYPKSVFNMLDLYRGEVLVSDFSSLECLGMHMGHLCFYSEYGILIAYDQEKNEYIEFSIVDKYNKELPNGNDVKELLELVELKDMNVVSYMIEKQFLHQKYQKKLEKKLSKENL